MSKWKHEPLKVNFPPFLGGMRPKTPVQTRYLSKQTECGRTVSRTGVYPGTNILCDIRE
jgi:hypothetical protein